MGKPAHIIPGSRGTQHPCPRPTNRLSRPRDGRPFHRNGRRSARVPPGSRTGSWPSALRRSWPSTGPGSIRPRPRPTGCQAVTLVPVECPGLAEQAGAWRPEGPYQGPGGHRPWPVMPSLQVRPFRRFRRCRLHRPCRSSCRPPHRRIGLRHPPRRPVAPRTRVLQNRRRKPTRRPPYRPRRLP